MNDVVPTVKIKTAQGPTVINLSDFDKTKHELADADELTPLKPLAPQEQTALFGSSIQPAGWNLPNGELLQLGTVVAEAHKRTGMTVEDWNKLPQDSREKLISDVVSEMVPAPEPTFSINKKRVAKGQFKFVVIDGAGNEVSEEFENQDDAKAQLELLVG